MELEDWSRLFGYSWKIFAVLTAITGLLTFHFSEKLKEKKTQEEAKNGKFISPGTLNKTELQKQIESNKESEYDKSLISKDLNDSGQVFLEIGGNLHGFDKSELDNDTGLDLLFGDSIVNLKFHDDELLITTKIFSFDGKIVAEISDNEWVVNQNNFFRKNFDRYGFEVVDNYDVVVLQVDYLNKKTIKINGIFLNEKQIIVNGKKRIVKEKPKSVEEYKKLGENIERIFKYGKKSQGKRI